MLNIEQLLAKLAKSNSSDGETSVTLADIMSLSRSEISAMSDNSLSSQELDYLYDGAQKALQANISAQTSILARINKDYANSALIPAHTIPLVEAYNEVSPNSADSFVDASSVASMFSPAAYLTALYGQARGLHEATSSYNLDARRPDIATTLLSQDNLDKPISTLALSNKILEQKFYENSFLDSDTIIARLANFRKAGLSPYDSSYSEAYNALIGAGTNSKTDEDPIVIDGDVLSTLLEDITSDNAPTLAKKVFGSSSFTNVSELAAFYNMSVSDIRAALEPMLVPYSSYTIGKPVYQDNKLELLDIINDVLIKTTLQREMLENPNAVSQFELLPLSKNNYEFWYSATTGFTGDRFKIVQLATRQSAIGDGVVLTSGDKAVGLNEIFTTSFDLDFSKGAIVSLTRYDSNSSFNFSSASFAREDTRFPLEVLLKLNKIILLSQTIGISIADIYNIIGYYNKTFTVDQTIIDALTATNFYENKLSIGLSQSLILSGEDIQETSVDSKATFALIFDTAKTKFSADGSSISLNPTDNGDATIISVLTSAYNCSTSELYSLWCLAKGTSQPGNFTLTIANLSLLYRLKLIADINALTVSQLVNFMALSPFANSDLSTLSADDLLHVMRFIRFYAQWLSQTGLGFSLLEELVSPVTGTTLSTEVEALIEAYKPILFTLDITSDVINQLIAALAEPTKTFLALDSTDMVIDLVKWVNDIKPGGLGFYDLTVKMVKLNPTEEETKNIIAFTGMLSQMAEMVKTFSLTADDLNFVLNHAEAISSQTPLPFDVATILLFSGLRQWSDQAGDILTLSLDDITNNDSADMSLISKLLSTYRLSGQTPYDKHYEAIRQALLASETPLALALDYGDIFTDLPATSLLNVYSDINPQTREILLEDITASTEASLQLKNFGGKTFDSLTSIARYYDISQDTLRQLMAMMSLFSDQAEAVTSDDSGQFTVNLNLNKLIRLQKATGLSTQELYRVISATKSSLEIDESVVDLLLQAQSYKEHYAITIDQSLVILGQNIGQSSYNGCSPFAGLFSGSQTDEFSFAADGTVISLNPDDAVDSLRIGALKNAFGVSDGTLYAMWSVVNGKAAPGEITLNIANISALYRIKVLAQMFGLSVDELIVLVSFTSYANSNLLSLTSGELRTLVGALSAYSQWLNSANLSVSQLNLMLTSNYATALSSNVESFMAAVKTALGTTSLTNTNSATLIATISPAVATQLALSSSDMAAAVLTWMDSLKPASVNVTTFLTLLAKTNRTTTETANLVSFCHKLNQIALMVRTLELGHETVEFALNAPAKMTGASALTYDLATIKTLSLCQQWLSQCGEEGDSVISALEAGTLNATILAGAMGLDSTLLSQGLAQIDAKATAFASWSDVHLTLEWVKAAVSVALTPKKLAQFITFVKNTVSKADSLTSSDWQTMAELLLAGLSLSAGKTVKQALAAYYSAALAGYIIHEIAPSFVEDRDGLYNWLLIDNKISPLVETTVIGEAIASIQHYVTLALSGKEAGVVDSVRSRAFFGQAWERYNKSFTSWAAHAKQNYYPENYINPQHHMGQTAIMDEMVETLEVGPLDGASVEQAFKTYLTNFNALSNLDTISGYHDSEALSSGISYFIGRSANGRYYWRSVNVGLVAKGQLPATAWTEWKEIGANPAPVYNMIRPVYFQSRLYILWLEQTSAGEYQLKFSVLTPDGRWNTPQIMAPDFAFSAFANQDMSAFGMYAATSELTGKVYVLFYKKLASYSSQPDIVAALALEANGEAEVLTSAETLWAAANVYKQFDTTSAVNLNSRHVTYTVTASVPNSIYNWGAYSLNLISANFKVDAIEVLEQKIRVNYSAKMSIIYNGFEGSISRDVVNALKTVSDIGVTAYVPNTSSPASPLDAVIIYQKIGDNLQANIVRNDDNIALSYYDGFIYDPRGFWYKNSVSLTDPYSMELVYKDGTTSTTKSYKFSDYTFINTAIVDPKMTSSVLGDILPSQRTAYSFNDSTYQFTPSYFEVDFSKFDSKGVFNIDLSFTANGGSGDGRSLGTTSATLVLTKSLSNVIVMPIKTTSDFAQYVEYGVHRIRLNSLLANQLVALANDGIGNVLSYQAQLSTEPQMGDGVYVDIELAKYDAAIFGTSGQFDIVLCDGYEEGDRDVMASGRLDKTATTTLRVFLPVLDNAYHGANAITIVADYQNGESAKLRLKRANGVWAVDTSLNNGTFDGLVAITVQNDVADEPLDFNGANGIYFWELFYYVPMMVAGKLLDGQNYSEATTWLHYIWNPDGYLADGYVTSYGWNVRPLEEGHGVDVSTQATHNQDGIAKADPLHYKAAVFMAYLELMITQADSLYRAQNIDQARALYVEALNLLGQKPWFKTIADWSNPTLTTASSQNTSHNGALVALRTNAPYVSSEAAKLADIFKPQQNEKLAHYRALLAERIEKLRQNLNLDGQAL